jgi:hypothetical protein
VTLAKAGSAGDGAKDAETWVDGKGDGMVGDRAGVKGGVRVGVWSGVWVGVRGEGRDGEDEVDEGNRRWPTVAPRRQSSPDAAGFLPDAERLLAC